MASHIKKSSCYELLMYTQNLIFFPKDDMKLIKGFLTVTLLHYCNEFFSYTVKSVYLQLALVSTHSLVGSIFHVQTFPFCMVIFSFSCIILCLQTQQFLIENKILLYLLIRSSGYKQLQQESF